MRGGRNIADVFITALEVRAYRWPTRVKKSGNGYQVWYRKPNLRVRLIDGSVKNYELAANVFEDDEVLVVRLTEILEELEFKIGKQEAVRN